MLHFCPCVHSFVFRLLKWNRGTLYIQLAVFVRVNKRMLKNNMCPLCILIFLERKINTEKHWLIHETMPFCVYLNWLWNSGLPDWLEQILFKKNIFPLISQWTLWKWISFKILLWLLAPSRGCIWLLQVSIAEPAPVNLRPINPDSVIIAPKYLTLNKEDRQVKRVLLIPVPPWTFRLSD